METLQRDLNILGDRSVKVKHTSAKKVLDAVSSEQQTFSKEDLLRIIKTVLICFEDKSERTRELCIGVVRELLPRCGVEALDWVLPSVVARIGIEPVAEESEELRLQLLQLAEQCLTVFPHDVGPRNFLDFFKVLLENCLKDSYPDLKKLACQVCVQLCRTDPKRVKHLTTPLAKAVKLFCLQHKHGAVRVQAVEALAVLMAHGAVELLGDTKDEQDNRTTLYFLFILCSDHTETVRKAVVDLLSAMLLDITERMEQHRRLLPHLLLLLSDASERIRLQANSVMFQLGKLHMLDNEDNSINVEKRRITLKDIEWYGDEEYPDMALTNRSQVDLPDLTKRPSLGARHVVAESVRTFLDKILGEVTSVNWTIPYSSHSRRVVALRQLELVIWYCESNIVQFAQQILNTLYKGIRDDDPLVRNESLVCVELLGKFMTPAQYLPFIIAKPDPATQEKLAKQEDDVSVKSSKTKTVTVVSADADPVSATPTLFSTAASVTKAGILIAFKYILLGSKTTLNSADALAIVRAVSHQDLLDVDSSPLLHALLDTILTLTEVLAARELVATPQHPMPEEVVNNIQQRTLDSILLYTALCTMSSDDAAVAAHAKETAASMSVIVTGDRQQLYDVHFGRLVARHLATMPVAVFEALFDNVKNIAPFLDHVVAIFTAHLSEVNYALRITAELRFFSILQRLLIETRVHFTTQQLEDLLRSIILVHAKFHPGQPAHLFRKIAIAALGGIIGPFYRDALLPALSAEGGALTEKVVSAWLNAVDADDMEMRLCCVTMFPDICSLALTPGAASDALKHIMMRFDDTSDHLRLETARKLKTVLNHALILHPDRYGTLVAELKSQATSVIKQLLIHLDDCNDHLGVRDEVCSVLKMLRLVDDGAVVQLTTAARTKHATPRYCDEILK